MSPPDFQQRSTSSVLQKKFYPRQTLTWFSFRSPAVNRLVIALFTIFFLFSSVYGGTAQAATYTGTFTFYSTATLNAVQVSELGLSTGTAYSEGTYTTDATWDGTATGQDMSVDQVFSSSVVQRNDVPIWYYIYKKSEARPTFSNLSYRIFSTSGIENKLSLLNDNSSTINATITAQPVGSSANSGTNNKICYGYANLTIDISTAKKSGTYKGTIQVVITYI
jgi:hypothetical protein